jgi:hypothetical protein
MGVNVLAEADAGDDEAQRAALRRLVRAFGSARGQADPGRVAGALWAASPDTSVTVLDGFGEAGLFLALLQRLIAEVDGPWIAGSHSEVLAAQAEAGIDGTREALVERLFVMIDEMGGGLSLRPDEPKDPVRTGRLV